MFIILLHYLQPVTEIEKYLPEHRDFLDKHYAAGHFIASGAQVPRTGGVILAKGVTREELDLLLNEDPFFRERLANYQIIEFNPSKHSIEAASIFT